MDSPTSGSSSDSSYLPSPLATFNPLAEHPFTNCSVDHTNQSSFPNHSHPSYAYQYGRNFSNDNTPHIEMPNATKPYSTISGRATPTKSYPYPSSRNPGIFVSFRRDAPSPDLPALKGAKVNTSDTRMPTSLSNTSAMTVSSSTRKP